MAASDTAKMMNIKIDLKSALSGLALDRKSVG